MTVWIGVSSFLFYTLPLLLVLIYLVRKRYQYWALKGIPNPTPIFPLGNFYQRLTECPKKLELKWGKKYERMYGLFTGLKPILTVTDPELIKQVLVKDFHLFMNRRSLPELHDVFPKAMFFVQGQDWKRIRSVASPTFTTGKLRRMYPLLHCAVEEMMSVLDNEYAKSPEIEIKSVTVGYTMAAIASTMFNINPGTNGDPEKFNQFRFHGRNILNAPHRFVSFLILPKWILRLLNFYHPLEPNAFQFMTNVCKKLIKNDADKQSLVSLLKEVSIKEKDLANMNYNKLTADEEDDSLVEKVSSEKTDKFLTENEIIATLIIFFFAGSESTASTISNLIFELAHNKGPQAKVQQEIDECFTKYENGDLVEKYEAICKLSYLDAVLKESMRKNPVVIRTERCLNADNYKLDGVEIEKGTIIEFPIPAIHMNDKWWPEPEVFNPERFMAGNKDKIVPYSYLPFGHGPRNCVAMRFALLEVRVALAHIIHKYSFDLAPNTPNEFTYKIGTPLFQAKPYTILFKKRAK